MDELIKKNVDHPSHYNQEGRKECIVEMREKFGDLAVYWFCKLNAYKYGYRAGTKDGNSEEQDKAKIRWYDDYAEKLQSGVKMDDVMKALQPWDDAVAKASDRIIGVDLAQKPSVTVNTCPIGKSDCARFDCYDCDEKKAFDASWSSTEEHTPIIGGTSGRI